MRISENSKKTLYLILALLLLSICSLTIVYAVLSATLNIIGKTEISSSSWDIYLANVNVRNGSVDSDVPEITGNDSLSFGAVLTTPGDFYEFTVDVVNDGSIDAIIDSVVKTPELTTDQAKYIKYEITYENGVSINEKQTLKKETTTPIKVRVEYRKDLSADDLPSATTELSLGLTLVYVQSDGSGSEIKNNGVQLVKVVSGDGTQVGDELCIEEECFYVISSTSDTVTMFAKYNLYVGGVYDNGFTAYGDEATGRQDSTMLGWLSYSAQSIRTGVTEFSNDSQHGTNNSDYSGSIVEGYVNDYSAYLLSQGVAPIEVRLITKDELFNLGCKSDSCSNAPDWVYSTTYWVGTALGTNNVWYVNINALLSNADSSFANYCGVRPVITISREYL